jgi:hypothetical protein
MSGDYAFRADDGKHRGENVTEYQSMFTDEVVEIRYKAVVVETSSLVQLDSSEVVQLTDQ